MSVLQTIANIRIPYATEGVIRTAQLDDTIAPENSVQLAVNMNFDRVGAIQTRPGVTQYADDLAHAVNNYGTLRNSIFPPGFDFISQFGITEEVSSSEFFGPSAVKITDSKIAIFWTGPAGNGYCRNFSIDQATGSVTPLGTALEFDAVDATKIKAQLAATDTILTVWTGTGGVALSQGFDISGDTIVAGPAAYQFDTEGFDFSLAQVTGGHHICFYGKTGSGVATILAINLSTLAVTEPGSPTTFDAAQGKWSSSYNVASSGNILNVWSGASLKPTAQTFAVNTGTWAISATGSPITFGSNGSQRHTIMRAGNDQYYVDIYQEGGVFVGAQTLSVNLSTYVVTTVGTPLPSTFAASVDIVGTQYDGTHFVAFYTSGSGGHVQMIEMNASTHNLTLLGTRLSGYDFGLLEAVTGLAISSTEVMAIWGAADLLTGKAAFFKPFGDLVEGRWLYASSSDEVFNTVSGSWTSRRSGLATVSKSRFSQYLNYIWMVNGNAQIGGDALATSNGGSFGTDLIPSGFPGGDFIQAGFEGRIWVVNKTLGVIYFTDIVQFIPPTTYLLIYNASVNFLSQLSPQTGQTFTAIYRVPRALLAFTEDSIFRIYGASSVDAYPAYNVGTYSQESIVETKTGIYFHHSSGFYQFDYGSQPVEISRRIIDFVKAIPRANYDDITGVYDGFDCIEWSVGQVTVEGVVFASCVLRYTISTQVWTVYDYLGNVITAMIQYDDGTNLNHLMGTNAGKTGAMDVGTTDFGQPFYYEFIDRWRAYTQMYYQTKSASGFSVYSENAAGANLTYQKQKSGPNAWIPIGTVDENNNSVMPNSGTQDFDVMRLRLAGNTKGAQVVVHGIEITSLTIKGQDEN